MVESQKISAGKKGWRIIKRILGFILPFIILVSIPTIFSYLLYNVSSLFGAENIRPDNRQEILQKNWDKFVSRGVRWIDPVDDENFELSLCPFSDDENWNKSISPEEAGFICGYVTVPLFHDLARRGNDPDTNRYLARL